MNQENYVRENGRSALFVVLTTCFILLSALIHAQTFPAGFSQVAVGNIYYPTSMAFAPDGRIFCTEKAGKVKIIKNGVVLSTPFLSIAVDQLNERGLSSIALDPNFSTNNYVYVYYTTATSPIHNRLSRFTANGDVAVPGSEVQILNFETCVNSIHNSGGMVFGNDGKLYLAVGNDNVNSNSQDLSNYKGKIIRINSDGSVPSGNPFTGSEPAKRIWAYGFRNPWSLAIQPGTGKIFANDVGEASWEEIDDITAGGNNYGWPGAEGMSTNPAYTNPLYTYPHGTTGSNDGCAITGGTFFNPSTTNYPSQYVGKYFFIDYCNNWINYLDLPGGVKHNFATNLPGGAENYIKVGNDGNLYYFSISQNTLYKIIYTNNNAPVITTQPSNTTVPQGQQATFTVAASGASPLNFQWQKNGVDINGATSSTYTISNVQPSHAGQYRARVTNNYGSTTSNQATLTVTAYNAPPTAVILSPASNTFYRSGDSIYFSGDGNDPEDGTIPANGFSWIVEFHHDNHIHPGPYIPPGIKQGAFSTTFGETSANVYFRLKLIVSDSQGLRDTAYVDIHPRTSMLHLNTQPSGLQVLLEGQPHVTPYSVLAVVGMSRSINVQSPQSLNSTSYAYDHWSQGGAQSQQVIITDSAATYTAVFNATGPSCTASGTILREFWANVSGYSVSTIPVNNPPTSSSQLSIFESPSNAGDNFGERVRGYLCPPETGAYTFWIASDDNSELWLSTNDMPANKVKIAYVNGYTGSRQWTKYPSQKSAPVNLVAGNRYYIEALHKEGTQGDNLAVGWTLPSGLSEKPILGTRLSPYTSSSPVTVTIMAPANNTSYSNPANITINASASSGNGILKVEFYSGSTKIGEDLSSPYSFTWMNVGPGSYALKAVAIDNMNQTATSSVVNVSVGGCTTPVITPMGPTTMCSGSVVLKTGTAPGNSYQWKKDGVYINGATSSSYTASATGDYQVKVINGQCVGWSAPTHVRIDNTLRATITPGGPTTICSNQNVVLYGNTCSGYVYQWKRDGSDIPGATASSYTANVTGTYQLKVTQNTTSTWSATVQVQVNPCKVADSSFVSDTDQKDSSAAFVLKVYPNPNSGLFTIVLNLATTKEEKVEMRIVNMVGQEIFKKEMVSDGDFLKELVELDSTLPTGIYTLQVKVGELVENTNVVLSR